jgi:hypothetical protein
MIQYDVAVIGGGAAGLTAAISAARNGARCVVLEHMNRVGKKLLATGNGKCNYTNALQGVTYYRGENPAFVLPVFEQFNHTDTIRFFQELGIYPKERSGYYYPASEQASSVLDVLRMELEYEHVPVYVSCEIHEIKMKKQNFVIKTNKDSIGAKKIIIATGLLASPKTGSDGSFFEIIKGFGHHFVKIVPALVQLQAKQSFFKSLAGIRAEMQIRLYIDGQEKAKEQGEIQLTERGISGIPVFQVSRFATRAMQEMRTVFALIDFAPKLNDEELYENMRFRFHDFAHGKTCNAALIGMFNKKLIDVLIKESGILPTKTADTLSEKELRRLCKTIKEFRVDIVGSNGFDAAQVCAGGVDTTELYNDTLESRLVPGLYFAGEVIDIDGTCGGYNLQWAWSSGYVAGKSAAAAVGKVASGCDYIGSGNRNGGVQ